ncbi:MAG: phage major capsid protein [Actinobacteria bacterium]|nr:phage major capsid protein [Actinomycetota bacterium]
MKSDTDYLKEAQHLVDTAERERRSLTDDERRRAESALKEVQQIRDHKALTNMIEGYNGALMGGSPMKSRGAPALDFSMNQILEMHKAAQSAYHYKATVDATAAPMAAVGDYRMTPYPFLRDKPRVANLIPVERTDAPTVFYFRGSTAASAAAAVAEGAAKPESSPVWTQVSAPVRKLAHFTRINDEVLQDFSNFRQVVGVELLAGLIDVENSQLLVGSGTAPNITGLLTTTGILTRARGTDSNLDAIAKAKSDLRVGASFTEPDAIVIHPTNLMSISTSKDTTGRYITSDPATPGPESLFGMRVVTTTKITLGTALMGNFSEAARLYVRQSPVVEIAPLGGGTTEFISNQTLARCEERLALAVPRPTALLSITGLT